MKALKPLGSALLVCTSLCFAPHRAAHADRPDGASPFAPKTQAERDAAVKQDRERQISAGAEFLKAQAARNAAEPERSRADGSDVTAPMLSPAASAATAKRLEDTFARHAMECPSDTWFGFCSHALPEVGFGPPSSSDGVDLLTLQKPDAIALALASEVESERLCTQTPCGSVPLFSFVVRGVYPPADDPKGIRAAQAQEAFLHPPAPQALPWTAEDWREFWGFTLAIVIVLIPVGAGLYRWYDTTKHEIQMWRFRRSAKSGPLRKAYFANRQTGEIISRIIGDPNYIDPKAQKGLMRADHEWDAETGGWKAVLRGDPNAKAPPPPSAPAGEHGTAGLASAPASGFVDDEPQGGPPVF